MSIWIGIQTPYFLFGSGSKEDSLYKQIFNEIFKNYIKTLLKIIKHMYYKRIITSMFPVLYSPNETVYFLGFFTPGSGSSSVHADPDLDPGGIALCGSVRIRIRIRNTVNNNVKLN